MSPALWSKYADAVVEILAKEEGVSVSELISRYQMEQEQTEIARLKRVYPDKDAAFLRSKAKLLDEKGAIREIVAEASQLILTRESRFVEKLKAKDGGLCKKIIALAKEAIRKMQEVLRNLRTPDDGVSAHIEKHLDELVGYFDEMMADTLDKAGRATVKDGVVKNQNRRITEGMSDDERYNLLKNRIIPSVSVAAELSPDIAKKITETASPIESWDDINRYLGSEKRNIINKLAQEFGTIGKQYYNESVDLFFEFSNNNFNETYKKQERNYVSFSKMFSVFDSIIEKAIGIEVHVKEKHKPDPTLRRVFVLVSAYCDGEYTIPVKLEIKEFKDKQNTLYVTIALGKIKTTEVLGRGNTENGVTQQPRSVNISISQLLSKINPQDKSFIKYIPDGFLDAERREIKQKAIEEDIKKDEETGGQFQHRRVGEEDRQVLARAAKSIARSEGDNEIVKSYFGKLEEYRAKQKELNGIADRLEKDNWGEVKGTDGARVINKLIRNAINKKQPCRSIRSQPPNGG